MKKELDILNNIKIVEWLKADLVETVGTLMKSLLKAGNDATIDALANLVIIAYILGHRLGISFQVIEMRIKLKLNNSINDAHETEQWYEDLTHLQKYMEGKESKKR
ncbi:MAG: MazG-like family protein [Syntrophomonadaceae bacterium]|nr:MazG-like family protein [Syntrophomonadaceae bacterium]